MANVNALVLVIHSENQLVVSMGAEDRIEK